MTTYVVTRHRETRERAKKLEAYKNANFFEHLSDQQIANLKTGDVVIGNLPAPVAARVCKMGAVYKHFVFEPVLSERGSSHQTKDIDAAVASPIQFHIREMPGIEISNESSPSIDANWAPESQKPVLQILQFAPGFFLILLLSICFAAVFETLKSLATESTGELGAAGALFFLLATIFITFALAHIVWIRRHKILKLVMTRRRRVRPKKVLIQGLSTVRSDSAIDEFSNVLRDRKIEIVAASVPTIGNSSLTDEERSATKIQWQQNVRSIYKHLDQLEHVIIICSSGDNGSGMQFEKFKACVEPALFEATGRKINVVRLKNSEVEYEDHEDIKHSFRESLQYARDKWQISEDDITIDVTAGFKIFSIAASAITINRNMEFTYVNNDGIVASYDASIALGDVS